MHFSQQFSDRHFAARSPQIDDICHITDFSMPHSFSIHFMANKQCLPGVLRPADVCAGTRKRDKCRHIECSIFRLVSDCCPRTTRLSLFIPYSLFAVCLHCNHFLGNNLCRSFPAFVYLLNSMKTNGECVVCLPLRLSLVPFAWPMQLYFITTFSIRLTSLFPIRFSLAFPLIVYTSLCVLCKMQLPRTTIPARE